MSSLESFANHVSRGIHVFRKGSSDLRNWLWDEMSKMKCAVFLRSSFKHKLERIKKVATKPASCASKSIFAIFHL